MRERYIGQRERIERQKDIDMTVIPSVSLPKPFYYSVCAEKPRIKTPERSGFLSWMSLKRLPDAPEGATGSFGRTDEVARLAEIYRELVS